MLVDVVGGNAHDDSMGVGGDDGCLCTVFITKESKCDSMSLDLFDVGASERNFFTLGNLVQTVYLEEVLVPFRV